MAKKPIRAAGRIPVTEVLDLRLLADEGLELDEPLARSWLDQQLGELAVGDAQFHAVADGRARLEISPLRPVATRPPIRITGDVEAMIETDCVRCLQPIQQALAAELDLTLFASGDPAMGGKDSDEELAPGELDEGTYEHNAIDLPSLVREAILLEVAMNPTCADEAGCTTRTERLLADANEAAARAVPDRWAALRGIAVATGAGGDTPEGEENEG